jgi:hypothetical protein
MQIDHTRIPNAAVPRQANRRANKKTGLNGSSAGITFPGLFSELFNVAASRPAQMTTT